MTDASSPDLHADGKEKAVQADPKKQPLDRCGPQGIDHNIVKKHDGCLSRQQVFLPIRFCHEGVEVPDIAAKRAKRKKSIHLLVWPFRLLWPVTNSICFAAIAFVLGQFRATMLISDVGKTLFDVPIQEQVLEFNR